VAGRLVEGGGGGGGGGGRVGAPAARVGTAEVPRDPLAFTSGTAAGGTAPPALGEAIPQFGGATSHTVTASHIAGLRVPSPAELVAELDRWVVGQGHAKRTLAVAVHNHYKRVQRSARVARAAAAAAAAAAGAAGLPPGAAAAGGRGVAAAAAAAEAAAAAAASGVPQPPHTVDPAFMEAFANVRTRYAGAPSAAAAAAPPPPPPPAAPPAPSAASLAAAAAAEAAHDAAVTLPDDVEIDKARRCCSCRPSCFKYACCVLLCAARCHRPP